MPSFSISIITSAAAAVTLGTLTSCAKIFADMRCAHYSDTQVYDECMNDDNFVDLSDDDIFCHTWIQKGGFKDMDECHFAQKHPREFICQKSSSSKEAFDKCLWRASHPIEAKCEDEAKIHGGYWECVRIEHEIADRQQDRQLMQQMHDDDAEAAKRQATANAVRDAFSNYSQAMQKAGEPSQGTTRCITKRSWTGNELVTECH